jgi:hypothetical protein
MEKRYKQLGRDFCVLVFCLLWTFAAGVAETAIVPSLCKISHPSDAGIEWECRRLRSRETLEGLFGERWKDVVRFNRVDRRHVRPGVYLKVPKRLDDVRDFTPMPSRYEPSASDPKFLLVDLSEQFLGAYEYGRLVFSSPIATGERGNETPSGEFRITAYHGRHRSSLYVIEKTSIPYPMNYGLRFHISKKGISFWIHGRDLPGDPASHGCVGLYDEQMQKKYYGYPKNPTLDDARILFEWIISPRSDDGTFHLMKEGPRVLITGRAPGAGPRRQ